MATPNVNRARLIRTVAKVAGAAIVGVLGVLYLSGYVFLWTIRGKALSATPVTFMRYAYYYADNLPVRRRLVLSGGVGVVLMGGAFMLAFWPRPKSVHGDARFATRSEIRDAGLLGNEGIILGKIGGRYLMLPGQQGVLVAAPPRSGKGVGIVVPNLLNFPGSVVCVDIKRENWTLTAGYRASRGHPVYLLDFFSETGRTAHWNPLDCVGENPLKNVDGLQRIGATLWPDVPGTDPFWPAAAQTMFLGVALYVFETPGLPRTIGEILRQAMVTGEEGFGAHWRRVIDERRFGEHPLSGSCVHAISDLVDLAGTTASGIRKTFTSRLDLWLNPILDAATSCSDFSLKDLRRKPISIYVGVNPADIGRLRRVLNLFFEQAIGEQTRELPEHNPELNTELLMVLDEFTALGRLPIISSSLGFLAGYNVRPLIIIQTPSQMQEIYGVAGAQTITKTCAVSILFSPKDQDDAEAISARLGMTTVKVKSRSRSSWGSGKGPSTNESERARPLMLPQEVKEMGADKEIVFYENLRPILAKKIRYFEDPLLMARILPPPEIPMILDPSRPPPPRVAPPKPEAEGRVIERIPAKRKARVAPIRPRQAPKAGSLAARNPPTDPAVIAAGVSAYLNNLTNYEASPGGIPPVS